MVTSDSEDRPRGDRGRDDRHVAGGSSSDRSGDGDRAAVEREISLLRVTELVVLSALREQDAASMADLARRRAEFLADASVRFGASLDEELTYVAIAGLELPGLDAWCIVDVVESGGGLRRIAVLHPDEGKRVVAQALCDRWPPAMTDPIGVPIVSSGRAPVVLTDDPETVLTAAARSPDALRVIRWLGTGPILIVPITAHDVVLGAITYVGVEDEPAFTPDDVAFAAALASRCAQALESARLYTAARAAWADAAAALERAEAARIEAEVARGAAETARMAAEAANATKTLFLRTMSHELRTPLHAIGGYAQMLALGVRGPVTSEQATDLASIQRCESYLLSLLNSVLDYAQLEAGRASFAITEFPVSEMISGAHWFVAPQLRAKDLRYVLEARATTLTVRADEEKTRQILLNVLGNAIKFTPSGGSITVTCERVLHWEHAQPDGGPALCAVRVTDTGIGIAADKVEHIFDPFVQVDDRFAGAEGGVGLGLSISRELARLMGGDLTVSSELGRGSTFTLTLPVAPHESTPSPA